MSDLEQQINEIKSSTILSSFDDKITLLQWLKKLEQAIKESNIKFLDYVKINELDNNQIQIELSFDGLKVYSNAVDVLSQTDDAVTEDSLLPVQSGAVYDEITPMKSDINTLNAILPLDSTPTENSTKGVTSGGVYNEITPMKSDINTLNAILPLDSTPTENSIKGVTSGGVYTALENAGITPRYEHNITARALNGTTTLGYFYYKIINLQATKFAFQTSVFDTLNIDSNATVNIVCTGFVKVGSDEYILTNIEKMIDNSLNIIGIEYNGTNFLNSTALTFNANGTIQTGNVSKIEVTSDYVITL